jgi:transcriptional regulator with XRE-family HTH domain
MISLPPEERIKSPYYWVGKIQLQLFRAINEYLEANDMTRKEFAEQLGVSKGYVSQILNGNFDHKLSKMIELMLAIGMVPSLEMVPVEEAVAVAKGDKKQKSKAGKSAKAERPADKKKKAAKKVPVKV